MSTPEVVDRVRDDWRDIRPLGEWLSAHVGPTEQEHRRFRR